MTLRNPAPCRSRPPRPRSRRARRQPRSARPEPPYVAHLRSRLEAVVHETFVPSAVVMVLSTTYGDATFTFGSLVLGENDPPSVMDHYRIGSNTKPMTATIILQLVQEGKLALERPDLEVPTRCPQRRATSRSPSCSTCAADWRTTPRIRPSCWPSTQTRNGSGSPRSSWHCVQQTAPVSAGNELALLQHELHPARPGHGADHREAGRRAVPGAAVLATRDAEHGHARPRRPSIPEPYAHGYHFGNAEETGGADPALPPAEQQAAAEGTLLPTTGAA